MARTIGVLLVAAVLLGVAAVFIVPGGEARQAARPVVVGAAPAPRPVSADDLEMFYAASIVSQLLECRAQKAATACQGMRVAADGGLVSSSRPVTPVDLKACKDARAAIVGDGIFEKLRDLRGSRAEQRTVAAMALNRCVMPDGDTRAEGFEELLRANIAGRR